MKRFFGILGLCVSPLALAGAPERANMVSVDLGGPGLLYSVNYERKLTPRWRGRIGASVFGLREHSYVFPSRDMVVGIVPPVSYTHLTLPTKA